MYNVCTWSPQAFNIAALNIHRAGMRASHIVCSSASSGLQHCSAPRFWLGVFLPTGGLPGSTAAGPKQQTKATMPHQLLPKAPHMV